MYYRESDDFTLRGTKEFRWPDLQLSNRTYVRSLLLDEDPLTAYDRFRSMGKVRLN